MGRYALRRLLATLPVLLLVSLLTFGLLWLVPAFLLYLLVLWILSNLVVSESPEAGHAG